MGYELSGILNNAIYKAKQYWPRIEEVRLHNQAKVLNAFRNQQICDYHLSGTTGYGYNDPAREALSAVFAESFQAEYALVQPQLISGTHAITTCLRGILKSGDHLISASGPPYDTLQWVINGSSKGSLTNLGVDYTQIPLMSDGQIDIPNLLQALKPQTKMVMLQRSPGYILRPSISISEIERVTHALHKARPDVCIFVDNCYGEFVEENEPTYVGVDLMAGSLIKNPGGTLAPSGGYIVGRKELVLQAGDALSAPGLGGKVGPLLGMGRALLQGLFIAPHVVGEALKGALVTAALFEDMGYEVFPSVDTPRSDIVQAVVLNDRQTVLKICQVVQNASPIDSTAQPVPGYLPGYEDPIIMAAGTFVQGSSLELSADAPMRSPYALFLQGGICLEHVLIVLNEIIQTLQE